jgi:putative addiction module killer protein
MYEIRVVKYFATSSGKILFYDWYRRIKDPNTRRIISEFIRKLEIPSYKNFKSVGNGIFELRIFYGPGYRVYFGFEDSQIVIILLGGDKTTQEQDIRLATKLWRNNLNEIR